MCTCAGSTKTAGCKATVRLPATTSSCTARSSTGCEIPPVARALVRDSIALSNRWAPVRARRGATDRGDAVGAQNQSRQTSLDHCSVVYRLDASRTVIALTTAPAPSATLGRGSGRSDAFYRLARRGKHRSRRADWIVTARAFLRCSRQPRVECEVTGRVTVRLHAQELPRSKSSIQSGHLTPQPRSNPDTSADAIAAHRGRVMRRARTAAEPQLFVAAFFGGRQGAAEVPRCRAPPRCRRPQR